MEKHPIDYLILVNPFHKIPEDFVDNLELVEMKGYDDEVFRVEKEAARQFCELQKATADVGIEILLSSAYSRNTGRITRSAMSPSRDAVSIIQGLRWILWQRLAESG